MSDHEDPNVTASRLVEHAWAHAHELAAGRFPADRVPGFFTLATGNGLMFALEAAAARPGATADTLLALVEAHLKGSKAADLMALAVPPAAEHAE